jgi:hypothetical protein
MTLPRADDATVAMYEAVINDVLNSLETKWRREGGSPATLQQLVQVWRARALKKCGVACEEPQVTRLKHAQMIKAQGDLLPFPPMFGRPPQPPAEEEDSMESADESSESSSEGSSGDSGSLGSDLDDPEIAAMLTRLPPEDTLVCHYVDKGTKGSGKGKLTHLEFTCAAFNLGGMPRVVKSGTADVLKRKT